MTPFPAASGAPPICVIALVVVENVEVFWRDLAMTMDQQVTTCPESLTFRLEHGPEAQRSLLAHLSADDWEGLLVRLERLKSGQIDRVSAKRLIGSDLLGENGGRDLPCDILHPSP